VALSLLRVTATEDFSIDLKEWFSANSIFANIITGLTQPIFNQRQVRTKFEVAKANQEKHIYSLNNRYLLLVKKFQML
jgi:outer membrane protein TolC